MRCPSDTHTHTLVSQFLSTCLQSLTSCLLSLQDTASYHSCAVSGCLHNPGLCLTHTHTHTHTSTTKPRFHSFYQTLLSLQDTVSCHSCAVSGSTHTHTHTEDRSAVFSLDAVGVPLSSGRNLIVRNTEDFL